MLSSQEGSGCLQGWLGPWSPRSLKQDLARVPAGPAHHQVPAPLGGRGRCPALVEGGPGRWASRTHRLPPRDTGWETVTLGSAGLGDVANESVGEVFTEKGRPTNPGPTVKLRRRGVATELEAPHTRLQLKSAGGLSRRHELFVPHRPARPGCKRRPAVDQEELGKALGVELPGPSF